MKKSQYLALVFALSVCAAPAVAQPKGDVAKGKESFAQCAFCHSADTTDKMMGPGLKGLFKKAKLESNGKPANEANITEKIMQGGNGMPPYDAMKADERANLIAYLKTL